jgi:hypothetical protein
LDERFFLKRNVWNITGQTIRMVASQWLIQIQEQYMVKVNPRRNRPTGQSGEFRGLGPVKIGAFSEYGSCGTI